MIISYKNFLNNCKKPPKTKFTAIYHPVTYPMSYLLFLLGLSPNAISTIGIILSMIGGIMIIASNVLGGLIILLISYLLDFCDGNVARFSYGYLKKNRTIASKKRGNLYENLYANVSYLFLFIPLGIYLYFDTGSFFFLYVAVATYTVKLISRYTALHMSLLNKNVADATSEEKTKDENRSIKHTIKYTIMRVINNARMYYISFIFVFLVFPLWFGTFFSVYMFLILFLSLIKIFLILVKLQP